MTERVLGRQVGLPTSPDESVLEAIDISTSKEPITLATVRFSVPEFTSLCPVTGQPDFAAFHIDFLPKNHLVESKSLKLFMGSFRNHGAFHEEVTSMVGRRIVEAIDPYWLRVTAFWYPRGGISIDVIWESCEKPKGLFVLPIDGNSIRGR
jgi:7-cyano-7-deazaguanine reductase